MPSKRPLKLSRWGISWERYLELSHFCRQYAEKRAEADALLTLRISTPRPETVTINGREVGALLPRGKGRTSDPVAAAAARREKLLRDVSMIDAAASRAAEGNPALTAALLLVVTTGTGVRKAIDAKKVPCGVNQFTRYRRAFFVILNELREGE